MSNLIRWNPNRHPLSMIDELFDRPWRSIWDEDFSLGSQLALNVKETDTVYLVEAELPGMNPEDIDIRVEDNMLSISGETSSENIEREGERVLMSERRYGKFSRSIRLPQTVDTDNIEATYENGILSLEITKLPEKQAKRIAVKALKNGKK